MPRKIAIPKAKLSPVARFAQFTLDFTFKRVFSEEECKDLLLFLLNTFLAMVLKKPIVEVEIINPIQQARSRKGRGAVFDMHCEDASGARFIVEMQLREEKCFIKRAFFYLCLEVSKLAKKGKMENREKNVRYDFNYPVVYTLSFLNFDLDFGKGCDEAVQYICLSNRLHPSVHYDIMNMVFVCLAKFDKSEVECKTDIDRLIFTFKNAHKLSRMPKTFNKAVFKRIYRLAKICNFTEEEHMDYEREMKYYSTYVNTIAFAEEEGEKKGMRKLIVLLERGVPLAEAKRRLGLAKR
jgi:predicted transposase/invertase (TIGR01784 family)